MVFLIKIIIFRAGIMNLDKSTKRIAKRVKKGFQGYPQISLEYFGETINIQTHMIDTKRHKPQK